MPRPWPVHLMAVAVLIGLMLFVLRAIGRVLPVANRDAVLGLVLAYAAVSLALVAYREVRRRRDRIALWLNRIVNASGGVVVIAAFWLLAPFADEGLLLVMLVYQVGTVTIQVVNAVEPPPSRGGRGLSLLALPASMALWFALHWQRFSVAVIAFAFAYSFVILSLRGFLQRALDRAYEARQAAETALIQVAAERDAKTRFLASASHDLGQPLQAARLFFDQTLRSRTAAQREAAARRVTWAFDATEQLLRQMLDHLRLEAGAVEPAMGEVAVGPLIARIAEMHEPAARLAGVTLLALPSRSQAMGDTALAERALGNLVANAIRHAKARRVLIGARRQAGRVRLWVIDDGVGIAEADASRLFDDYVQGSNHGDEIRGGFGLGLASARRMAGLMAGSVGLERKWTRGSAFWLELAATEAKAP
jgi:signal transduction histidine kinase